ncbi:hypothetical protein ACFLSJ_05460 [Verrucomicrobiota bacterium]
MTKQRKRGSLGVATVLTGLALAGSAAAQTVWINEIHYDNTGTDQDEGVEIAGPTGTDLTGFTVEKYNGNDNMSYGNIALSGMIDDEGGGYGALWFDVPANGLQNGEPDGIALVDDTNAVLQFLSYEGTMTAGDGPAAGMASADIGVAELERSAIGDSLQLTGTGSSYDDFTWTGPTAHSRGDLNTGQTVIGGGVSNRPPYVMLSPRDLTPTLTVSNSCSITVTAVEPDGDTITLTYSDMPPGATLAPATNVGVSPLASQFDWTPDAAGSYSAVFIASDDGDGAGEPVTVNFTVYEPTAVVTGIAAYINEFRADDSGDDDADFVEIIAPAGINLEGCTLVHYNGNPSSDGTLWTFSFPRFIVPEDGCTDTNDVELGFVVLAQDGSGLTHADFTLPGSLQNGPDGLVLYDAAGNILDAVAWEGAGDLPTDDPGTVTTGGDPAARHYLAVTEDDDSGDNGLAVRNNVRNAEGTDWEIIVPTPGWPNGNQTCGRISVTNRRIPKRHTGLAIFTVTGQ